MHEKAPNHPAAQTSRAWDNFIPTTLAAPGGFLVTVSWPSIAWCFTFSHGWLAPSCRKLGWQADGGPFLHGSVSN